MIKKPVFLFGLLVFSSLCLYSQANNIEKFFGIPFASNPEDIKSKLINLGYKNGRDVSLEEVDQRILTFGNPQNIKDGTFFDIADGLVLIFKDNVLDSFQFSFSGNVQDISNIISTLYKDYSVTTTSIAFNDSFKNDLTFHMKNPEGHAVLLSTNINTTYVPGKCSLHVVVARQENKE